MCSNRSQGVVWAAYRVVVTGKELAGRFTLVQRQFKDGVAWFAEGIKEE